MPQTEHVGKGTINKLKEILLKHNPKNIFLVTGRASYEKCGAKAVVDAILKGYNMVHFYDFEVNPKLKDVEEGVKVFNENNCDFVIAVGGGSVMDVAKAINIFAANEGDPLDFINKKDTIENKGKTLVAIPTTSGSGSEATNFAVIYVDKTKYSLVNNLILPDYAIVDYQFTYNLPKNITASSGMDALSQGIESYWSVNSTEESRNYSRETIRLAINNLLKAVNNPSEESSDNMSRAAHLAGKAINISKTTACHAVSYPITSYFNVPHGHAVALTLAPMLVYNSRIEDTDFLDKRGVDYVKNIIKEIVELIGANSIDEASHIITNLMNEIGLKTNLTDLGIRTEEDIDIVIKNGFNPERVKNNPRQLTEDSLREILNEIR